VPLSAEQFDEVVRTAEQQSLSHLEFLERVIGPPANQRRERSVERRIRDACFHEVRMLEDFDWTFNASAINRVQIEELATGEFTRRGDNLVMVGQSGVGKSHLLQALGRRLCVLGYRVRYTTSAELLVDLTKSLADQTLPKRLRYWTKFDLLIIDEFGFDRVERAESPQAANLLYKVIDARSGQRSTALGTNIDFDAWSEYLGDPPLAMAFLDRVVDGAILMKIQGRSYRAHRAKKPATPSVSNSSP
jgi:DNA replication protein DnaC